MPAYTPPRRRSIVGTLLFAGLFLGVAAAGIAGTLTAVGVDLVALWKPREPDRTGMVPVPTAARKIAAYSRVTRDDLMDPVKKQINVTWLPQGAVPEGVILEYGKIIGRVLKSDKNPTYVFTEKEFYPLGTSSGITAAIPPGKRSFVFAAEKVGGMASLKPGDHFDIVATQSIDDGKPAKLALPGSAAGLPPGVKRASVKPVVQNGVVLTGVTVRQVTTSSTGLTTGTQYKTRPVEEMTVAVDPDEVVHLTESLSVSATLTALARSGQPGEGAGPDMPIQESAAVAPPRMTTIETIVNGKKEVMTFPEPAEPAAKPAPKPAKGSI